MNLGEYWKVEPFYSTRRQKGGSGWGGSDLLSANVYYSVPLERLGVNFENRIRIEENFDNEREEGRARVKFSKDVPLFGGSIAFAGNEIIYDFSGGDLKENRASVGSRRSSKAACRSRSPTS